MAPYTKEISRQNPACLLFLLDQSFSMEEPLAGDPATSKCKQLASAINTWLAEAVIACTRDDGVGNFIDIGVIGYRTDIDATPIVEPALKGALANRWLVGVADLAQHPLRVETYYQPFTDRQTGDTFDIPIQRYVWLQPKAEGGTPMCRALRHAQRVLSDWIVRHADSFPPIVVHITDGESQDGDPLPHQQSLTKLATNNGQVLMFNCHLSSIAADQVLFPCSDGELSEEYARILFSLSSELPDSFLKRAKKDGLRLRKHARGMAFNANMATLIRFLELGTGVTRDLSP